MGFNPTVFALGVIGGALAELLKWYQLRESSNFPAYARSWIYWLITILMVAAGGLLAVVQGVEGSKPLLALNIGISAPLILKGLATTVPAEPQAKGLEEGAAGRPSVIDFIAGR
jgi:hypothetical protein